MFVISLVPILALYYFWNAHADKMSSLYENPFTVKGNLGWYLWGDGPFHLKSLLTLGLRLCIYVVSPVVLVSTLFLVLVKKIKLIKPVPLCISIILYLITFSNLNVHHNYYQLPLVLPFFLLLAPVLLSLPAKLSSWGVITALFLSTGFISYDRLIKQDEDWVRTSRAVVQAFGADKNAPVIKLYSNSMSGAIALAYDLRRFVKHVNIREFKQNSSTTEPALFLCDHLEGANCKEAAPVKWVDEGHVSYAIVK